MITEKDPAFEQLAIEAIRHACVHAALEAYRDASIHGLCHEGAWEAALSGIRRANLIEIARPSFYRATPTYVRGLMTRDVVTLRPDDQMATAEDVMRLGRIRHLPVCDVDGDLCGLVSQRDLTDQFNRLVNDPDYRDFAIQDVCMTGIHVADVMTRDVVATRPECLLRNAAGEMLERKIGCLPVVDEGELVGILTERDFVRAFV